jgi:predicted transcriptional regulator
VYNAYTKNGQEAGSIKKETTFHLPNDLVVSLKMRAVQENQAYSAVAEEAIQEYLSKRKEA